MCLILFAWQSHPDFPLIVAANRDEFYARATRPVSWWGNSVSILAGRDEEAGGTWFGINRRGRVAFLTNVRRPDGVQRRAPSRGLITLSALQSPGPISHWHAVHQTPAQACNGYNLVIADPLPQVSRGLDAQVVYLSNRGESPDLPAPAPRTLDPGIYGLSNAALDTPWPKLTRSLAAFACQVAKSAEPDSLMQLMADRHVSRDSELPDTGIPLDWERALSAIQVRANGYGTRATTVCLVRRDGQVTFCERSFHADAPHQYTDRRVEFVIDGAGNDRQAVGFRQGEQG